VETHSRVGRGGGWVVGQLAFGAVALVLGLAGPGWADAARPLVLAGWLLLVAGFAMLVAGGGVLGSSLTPFPRPSPGSILREHGIYRFVRHPMYGGTIVMFVGFALVSSPLAFAGVAALALFLDLKSRQEERWLAERYPGYEDYRHRTRWKFVPGLR
jgi:protein-S-isoprenylcysteine O-methyltransferase Ste14